MISASSISSTTEVDARTKSSMASGMDIIFVRDIRLDTLIGAYEHERRQPRTLQVDIEIGRDAIAACQSDELADTIDYAAVVDLIKETFSSHSFHLLEPLAEFIVDQILEKFDAQWARIEVSKTGVVPDAGEVGVRIERRRH